MQKYAARTLGLVAAAALVASGAVPASAKPPTRITETYTSVVCEAFDGDVRVVVSAEQSVSQTNGGPEQVVTGSRAQLTLDGETIGRSEGTPSDWTSTTFRVTMPVSDQDDNPVGEVGFSATLAPTGSPQTSESSFKDGNRRIVERYTETALALSDVVVQRDGEALEVERCDGSVSQAAVSFTNPAMLVQRGSSLPYDSCVTTGQLGVPFIYSDTGRVDELFVESQVGTNEELLLRGLVTAGGGTWSGSLELELSGEDIDQVPSTATLTRLRPFHQKDGRDHFHVTPYRFSVDAGTLGTFTCTVYSVHIKTMTVNSV